MAKKSLKIKVVGTGGIGLCVLPSLCRYLNYSVDKFPDVQIGLIDGDVFEDRNRERQSFSQIGPKATMTAESYSKEFPRLTITDHPVYLDENNIFQHLREGDTVLVCVDNHKTRKLISDRAEELKNITIISGGNDLTDGNVLVHIRKNGKNITPPLASEFHPEIANPMDKHPGEVVAQGCQAQAPASPQLLFTNNLIAANMLAFLHNVIDEDNMKKITANPQHWHELCVDMESPKGPKAVVRERFVKN
ncbi:MAG: ThiF family adenylyltransferase [Neisseriaceae bacterium]|nr:MAG: ThiF family adenylyltransferase [Neisseriaceae bacterium]